MYFVFLFNIRFIFYDQHFFYDSHTVPRLWGWLRPQFYSFLNVLLWGVGVQQRCGVQAGVLQSWQAQARRNYKGECKTRYHSPHLVQIGHVRIQFQRKHRILWRLLMRTVHSEPPTLVSTVFLLDSQSEFPLPTKTGATCHNWAERIFHLVQVSKNATHPLLLSWEKSGKTRKRRTASDIRGFLCVCCQCQGGKRKETPW